MAILKFLEGLGNFELGVCNQGYIAKDRWTLFFALIELFASRERSAQLDDRVMKVALRYLEFMPCPIPDDPSWRLRYLIKVRSSTLETFITMCRSKHLTIPNQVLLEDPARPRRPSTIPGR